MDNLSCGSWKGEGRDKAKELLINYFIEHGYGQDIYSEEDIRQMFKEMDALGMLFPKNGKSKIIDVYAKWRKRHYNYWFKNGSGNRGVNFQEKMHHETLYHLPHMPGCLFFPSAIFG